MSAVTEIADTLPDDPRECVIALDHYICENFEYDIPMLDESLVYNPKRTLARFLDERKGICQQYAELFYLVAQAKGIPCRLALSSAQYLNHIWNQVCIDGEWCNMLGTDTSCIWKLNITSAVTLRHNDAEGRFILRGEPEILGVKRRSVILVLPAGERKRGTAMFTSGFT